MPLKKDKWPNFYFYDVTCDKHIKVHCDDVKLKKGSTKGRALGTYYAIIAKGANSNGNDIWRFISEDTYTKLKKKFSGEKRGSPSAKASKCNRVGTKRKLKKACKSSKKCRWVSGQRKSRGKSARRGYCRRK